MSKSQIPISLRCRRFEGLNESVDAYLSEYYSSQFLLISSTCCCSESVAAYDSYPFKHLSHIKSYIKIQTASSAAMWQHLETDVIENSFDVTFLGFHDVTSKFTSDSKRYFLTFNVKIPTFFRTTHSDNDPLLVQKGQRLRPFR